MGESRREVGVGFDGCDVLWPELLQRDHVNRGRAQPADDCRTRPSPQLQVPGQDAQLHDVRFVTDGRDG